MRICKKSAIPFAGHCRKQAFFYDLLDLKYIIKNNGEQRVMAIFPGGYVYVNVTGDSGWAMAFDILKQLPRNI